MNLNDYFDPVSLDKPVLKMLAENLTFSSSIDIHTTNSSIGNIEKYDIAFAGIPEEKNAIIPGSAQAPDRVRSKLYQLSSVNRKIKIIDLGNLKITDNINDTYCALRDITIELRTKNLVVVFVGGSQDLTYGINLAFDKIRPYFTLATLDARIDLGLNKKRPGPADYLDHILIKGRDPSFFNYINIGHQIYFTHLKILDQLGKKGYESIRLGTARTDLTQVEPYIRDAGLVSVDMSCVRQSDAPGVNIPSPNGFFGHELCQLTRYAGTSGNIECIGFFELLPDNDLNDHTSHLTAQAIWYFMEGYSLRILENAESPGNKKYHIHLHETGYELIFYRSTRTDRWWMELPFINKLTGKNIIISCTSNDYDQACRQEIPDRWWKAHARFSGI